MQIQKLKNKLGTRQLPTAELLLDGVTAYKVISLLLVFYLKASTLPLVSKIVLHLFMI
jgi:hypothetical protein